MEREHPRTLCLFDVDGTLTVPRAVMDPKMKEFLETLRKKCVIGLVGGSDLVKIQEQVDGSALTAFDFTFAENGLTAFKAGEQLASQTFLGYLGEDRLQKLVNYCLKYIANLEIPQKRGTFVEFRNGMLNVSPIGRNCSRGERNEFEKYDKEHGIRKAFVAALENEFSDWGIQFSIGGQISFDVFPVGWDKTYCLQHVGIGEDFDRVHFFGDKTFEGGNDFEIYTHKDTIGHSVTSWEDTIKQVSDVFNMD
eukprot:m.16255 g.16255  ORF g.16255 m.16255 type:complete len:251 (+) comp4590_c0_seq1:74-826(+)